MPILKQLVLSSSQAKRRSRADLTAEMISAPLGDFRHTMHVGRGGDAFGDTSFLSSRCVEPPRVPQAEQSSSPKQGLLARTFRGSKRSHSNTRNDTLENSKPTPPSGSPGYVKNAISLPYLNDERARTTALHFPMSVSSSPARKLPEANQKPANGPTTPAVRDLELIERDFGEPTDLPVSSAPPRGGMKHAESVLSFHIDLGPSMLGDILSVMDRKEDMDLGLEEEPHSPMYRPFSEPAELPLRPPRLKHAPASLYTPGLHSQKAQQQPDRCSVFSSGSMEKSPHKLFHDHTNHAQLGPKDDRDFSFMDEDDDEEEIRV
ncbi:cdc42 effector protein 4 [Brachyhypopomus gauderio]|uniref:cdc42 effector protein 4 n=1 Tax=Brachyhypopomus gauderio TaxID=698409 RepID=UPI00404175E8